jgi:hypothetical protein
MTPTEFWLLTLILTRHPNMTTNHARQLVGYISEDHPAWMCYDEKKLNKIISTCVYAYRSRLGEIR